MIIDVRRLNTSRKYTGDLHFEVPAKQELVTLPMAEMISPITVDAEYDIYDDDSVELTGRARYLLRGACSRCLKPLEREIEIEWNPLFVKGEPQDEEYSYENGSIDPTESVYDAVMLNMPYTLLCEEGCEGIAYDHQGDENE